MSQPTLTPLHVCRYTKERMPVDTNEAEIRNFASALEFSAKKAGYAVNWLPPTALALQAELNGQEKEQVLARLVEPIRKDNTVWASHDHRIWNR